MRVRGSGVVLKGGGRRGWVCCCVGGCSVVEDMFFSLGFALREGFRLFDFDRRSSDSETAGFLCSRRLGVQVGVVGCVKWWIGLDCGCQKVDSIHQIEFLTDALHLQPHHHPSMPSQNRNGKTRLLPLEDELQ